MHLKPHRRGVFFILSVWQRVNGRWLSDQSERVIYFCYVIKQNIKIPFYYLAWCLVLCSNFVPRALFPGFGDGAKPGKSALGTRLGLIRRTSYAWPGLTVNSADGKNSYNTAPIQNRCFERFQARAKEPLARPCLKTFVAPFLPPWLTAPGSPKMRTMQRVFDDYEWKTWYTLICIIQTLTILSRKWFMNFVSETLKML